MRHVVNRKAGLMSADQLVAWARSKALKIKPF